MEARKISHISFTVEENNLLGGASEILKQIRPLWKPEAIQYKLLTDGITNKLVACKTNEEDEKETVLIRVYGNKTDLLIDRTTETKNILLLNSVGLAPRLYATFENGLAYEFVPGCTLDEETVKQPEIFRLVALRMAKLHQVTIPDEPRQAFIWKKIQQFLDLVPERFSDSWKHKQYEANVIPKSQIEKEVDMLKEKLTKLDSPVVFSHNDLLLKNIIYTEENNSVTFIDYEYASYNYQAFDIANHFAEFAGVNEVNYDLYPSKEFQYEWIKIYLSSQNKEVSEADIEKLYVQVCHFVLVSHIFWGIWALIQAEHSYIDFDFMGYAAIRLNEYLSKKEQFLALQLPNGQ